MSTEKQIAASRANGARSQGPKTPEGEIKSSRNSLKHGLLAQSIVLDTENPYHFRKLLADFIDEFQPSTAAEMALVETMTVSRWRQKRLWTMEKAGLQHQIATQEDTPEDGATQAALAFQSLCDRSRSLELLNRYEARYDRQFARALSRLAALKALKRPAPPQEK